ncbi:MAG: hypothetical protein KJZ85_20825 [Rhodobacteraceae bacterium]|jgi:hypothetical protein|nr:hypothetical protein [Paracoccaceae bacterium]
MGKGWGRAAGATGLVVGAVLAAGGLKAGPLGDVAAVAVAAAEARLAEGQGVAAIAALDPLVQAVWAAAPLGFAAATLVASPPAGFGLYEPRADIPFAPGEPIRVYAEPVGFGHGRVGEFWEIAFDVDLAILDAEGRRIARIDGIQTIALRSRAQMREFPAAITYDWSGAGPGRYRLVTTLRDRHSGKAGSFELAVEIGD